MRRDFFGSDFFRITRWRATWLICAVVAGTLMAWSLTPDESRDRPIYGAYGPEGTRLREQLWILPGADPKVPLRATVFRPADSAHAAHGLVTAGLASFGAPAAHPLVIINHGTDPALREAASMPVFYWLSRWFVERGYVVVVPQRRGFGATGGDLVEAEDSCLEPDHLRSGDIAADDIQAVLAYMIGRPFVKKTDAIVAGVSTGGWASLALASRNPAGLGKVINFAGGRGGHADGRAGEICGEQQLIEAAGQLAQTSHVPTLWLYAMNDSYFPPRFATMMADAWRRHGGPAELHLLPPYGFDGHALADDRAGWDVWGPVVDAYLDGKDGQPALDEIIPAVEPAVPEVIPPDIVHRTTFRQ